MRPLLIILTVALVFLQHKLWLGEDSVVHWRLLEEKLTAHQNENNKLSARNKAIAADIYELKQGDQALEEQARFELGMIKDNETFYQFAD